jgi:hypothetical protein
LLCERIFLLRNSQTNRFIFLLIGKCAIIMLQLQRKSYLGTQKITASTLESLQAAITQREKDSLFAYLKQCEVYRIIAYQKLLKLGTFFDYKGATILDCKRYYIENDTLFLAYKFGSKSVVIPLSKSEISCVLDEIFNTQFNKSEIHFLAENFNINQRVKLINIFDSDLYKQKVLQLSRVLPSCDYEIEYYTMQGVEYLGKMCAMVSYTVKMKNTNIYNIDTIFNLYITKNELIELLK